MNYKVDGDENTMALGESVPRLVDVPYFPSDNGALGVVQASDQCGFTIKRHYYLLGAEGKDVQRGAHAHKELYQFMVCLRGRVEMTFKSKNGSHDFILDHPGQGVWVPPGYWRDFTLSSDAVLSVLASENYDEADYIRDYDVFTAWEREREVISSVPYVALDRCHKELKADLQSIYDETVRGNAFIQGAAVATFEQEFADYCGATQAIGCGNGLDALTLILRGLGVGAGDEVIVPANSFIATALAVELCGATSVFADCDPQTYSIDVQSAAKCITDKTKAIIPVHLYGIPAPMDEVTALAHAHNLYVIEDAAQAHGAVYKGRTVGSIGHASAFSFYPTKNMGALGDAGAVVTNDATLAKTVRMIGNYGSEKKYHHVLKGVNSRLDTMQAAVLSLKLKHIAAWNERRRALAHIYYDRLSSVKDISLAHVPEDTHPVWHVFPIRMAAERRDDLIAFLGNKGIGTNIHYPVPIHKSVAYQSEQSAPVAARMADALVSLPLDPYHTGGEIYYVCDQIRAYYD